MAKYHINPTTGEPGQCKARKSCPFGDLENDHYTSAEAAREAFEALQESFPAAPASSGARESVDAMEAALAELRNLTNDRVVIERFTNRNLFQEGFVVGSKSEGYKPDFQKVRDELWSVGTPQLADDFEAYLREVDSPGQTKQVAEKPNFDGLGKIRFYSSTDESGIKDVANRARNIFERKPYVKIGVADKAGGGTGVSNISYNPETKEYAFGKSRMRFNTELYSSKSLDDVVRYAADQEGYADSEYSPLDWDE